MNTKIKIFEDDMPWELEKKVNVFLSELSNQGCEIIDIKYSLSATRLKITGNSVMVIYCENKEGL